eukprot:321510_1
MTSLFRLLFLFYVLYISVSGVNEYRYFVTTQGPNPTVQSLWIGEQENNATTHGKLRGCIPYNNSNWKISEWHIPSVLPLNATFINGSDNKSDIPCTYYQNNPTHSTLLWYTHNSNGIVCLYWNNGTNTTEIELHQHGTNDLPCGQETDLFASPIHNDPGYPIAFIGLGNKIPYLSDMKTLTLQFEMKILLNYSIILHCGTTLCGEDGNVDYGYATVGIPIHNTIHSQTIMYQIGVFNTRQNLTNCTKGRYCEPNSHWYGNKGYMNTIASFNGYSCLEYGIRDTIQFESDILPYYKAIFNNTKNCPIKNLDTNLSNWQVGGFYIGEGIRGLTDVNILVSNIDLVAYF